MSTFSDFEASPLGAGWLRVSTPPGALAFPSPDSLAGGVVSASEVESEPLSPQAARPRESATRAAMTSGFNSMRFPLPGTHRSNQSVGTNTLLQWRSDHEGGGLRSRSGS